MWSSCDWEACYFFYLLGGGEEADTASPGSGQDLFIGKGVPEEKFRHHGRNSPALLSILTVWAFFFFPLPGRSLPKGQIQRKIVARADIFVVDGGTVNFTRQLDQSTRCPDIWAKDDSGCVRDGVSG